MTKTEIKFFENLRKYQYKLIDDNFKYTSGAQKVQLLYLPTNQIFNSVVKDFSDGYLPHRKNKRKTIEEFKKEVFDLVGDEFQILDGEVYKGNKFPIKMIHKVCGRVIDTLTPCTFLSGKRCKYCSHKTTPSISEVLNLMKINRPEYEIVDNSEYKDMSTDIHVKHNICNKIFITRLSPFLRGERDCPNCSWRNTLKTQEEFEADVKNYCGPDFKVLEKYTNTFTPIAIQHIPCQTIQKVRPFDFLYNRTCKCLNCAKTGTSKPELELREIISNLGFSVQKYKRKINGHFYEIDAYVESKKIGFEFNGLYWHSDKIAKNKLNIFQKMEAYKTQEIKIINIFEDEWTEKKEIVIEKIKYILGVSNKRHIYARNCLVQEISKSERNLFLNKYHLQGTASGNVSVGLFYKNELISVMVISNNKSNNSNKFELVRYASSDIVPGGFSKLLSYLIKKYKITEIDSYADLRWSDENNNIYKTNGFALSHKSRPSRWFTINKKRFHRYNFTKKKLKVKFPDIYDDNLTVDQIINKTKYRQIWDCGQLVYKLRI